MRPHLPLILAVLAVPLLAGCFKHSVRDERKQPGPRTSDDWKPYAVVGLAPLGKSTVTTSCPGGLALVESHTSFANALVTVLTFNLFTPITVAYACAEGDRPASPETGGTRAPHQPAEEPAPAEDDYDVPIL